MTKEQFDFWQDHSATFLEMAFKTDRMEPLENPDGEGLHTGDCGDTVAMSLKLGGKVIEQVAFKVQGCLHTVASANAVAELIEGRPIEDAWELTPERVIDFLKTLPKAHYHCAELAVGALYRALADVRNEFFLAIKQSNINYRGEGNADCGRKTTPARFNKAFCK